MLEKTASEESFAANKDQLIEEDSSHELNRTITVQITTDSDLNDNQTCIENLLVLANFLYWQTHLQKRQMSRVTPL